MDFFSDGIGVKELFYFIIPACLIIVDLILWLGLLNKAVAVIADLGLWLTNFAKYLATTAGHKNAKYACLCVSVIYVVLMLIFG